MKASDARIPHESLWGLLARYLRPQRKAVAVMGALILSSIGLQLIGPQIIRYIIDEAIAGSPVGTLIAAGGLFVGVALLELIATVSAAYASVKVGWTATNALRSDLARHCMHLDVSFHHKHPPGEMIERVDGDVDHLGNFFSVLTVEILGGLLLLVSVIGLVFREDWRAGLAMTGLMLLTMLVAARMRNAGVGPWKEIIEASADKFAFIEERLGGTEDIRSSNAVPYVVTRFTEFQRNWSSKRRRGSIFSATVVGVTYFSFDVATLGALAIGAYLHLGGWITIGTVFLIYHYANMLGWPIWRITTEMVELQQARAAILRIGELARVETKVPIVATGRFPSGPPGVEFNDVSFEYTSGVPVLKNVSFEIPPGSTLGLLGRTGSGKTTITRLLLRLYDVRSGRVSLGGMDIRNVPTDDLRRRTSVVTQDVRTFNGTLRDNITLFYPEVSDERLLAAIEEMGLTLWYRSLSSGLDTVLSSTGAGLSAGEEQLLALSRAFVKDPSLVVLDEASSRLDRGTEYLISGAVDRLVRDRTTVIIAHRLSTIERVDRVLLLEDGEVLEEGDRTRLAGDPGSTFHRLLRTGLEEVLP